MEAIRKFIKVEGKTIHITLPDNFYADEVEVIILPKGDDFDLTEEMKAVLDSRLNEPTTDYLSAEQSIYDLKKKIWPIKLLFPVGRKTNFTRDLNTVLK